MIKNYMTTGAFAKGQRPEGDLAGKVVMPFREEEAVMSIYGGPAPPPPTSTDVNSSLQAGQSTP
jgi:hypothetical protein